MVFYRLQRSGFAFELLDTGTQNRFREKAMKTLIDDRLLYNFKL